MAIHLATVLGGDVPVAPQMLRHYRELGVSSFYLVRQGESADDPNLERIEAIAAAEGISILHTHLGPWDQGLNATLFRRALDERPNDWYVLADSDELLLLDRPLDELVAYCEEHGYDYVEGCILDRLAADGSFPAVRPGPLWEQYPLAGAVSMNLLVARPTKIVLARGWVRLADANHIAKSGRGCPRREIYAQVHHFKWTGSVVERLRDRARRYRDGTWKVIYPETPRESEAFLEYVETNGGRIDVTDPRFLIAPVGRSTGDYPYWHLVTRIVEECWPPAWRGPVRRQPAELGLLAGGEPGALAPRV